MYVNYLGIILILLVATRLQSKDGDSKKIGWLHALFFCSGAPALIYQIVWQRSLFALYGINVESVAAVVSAFMLGLGLGSLLGGRLSQSKKISPLALFGCSELGIAVYGVISLKFFHIVAERTAGASTFTTALLSFVLLAIPTVLMGATLPLLITHLVRISKNVAYSVGTLYFVNTLGSATACFFAADILMRHLGQSGSVLVAASMNAIIGSSALILARRTHIGVTGENTAAASALAPKTNDARFSLPFGMLVAGLSGFLALAYEIIWYRVLAFATGGSAKGFAYVLGSYLAGIALGSVIGERYARQAEPSAKMRAVTAAIAVSAMLAFLLPPTLGLALSKFSLSVFYPGVVLVTTTIGFIFPLISDLTLDPDPTVGEKFSFLYLANILGCTAGSLLVGFVLMDVLSIARLSGVLLAIGLIVAAMTLFYATPRKALIPALAALLIAIAAVPGSGVLYANLYHKLLYKDFSWFEPPFAHVVETKSGVVAVTHDGTVYGGGVYDGVFNVSLENDRNLVIRTFAVLSLQPHPRRALMIGLASGSWGQIIANHPEVQEFEVVEINPGYLELISKYPEVSSLLHNPKVHINIDDGRRWLISHPNEKFDLIVMNTTWAWREHASNLLSREFMELSKQHLLPGGVMFFNTTISEESRATAVAVFPHALRILNFVAVSDHPLEIDPVRWRSELLNYRVDGRPVIETEARLQKVLSLCDRKDIGSAFDSLETSTAMRARLGKTPVITDDNMGIEWRY